jgi:hypothetical protein
MSTGDTVNKAVGACDSGGKPSQLLGDKGDIDQFLKHHSCNDFEQIKGFSSLGRSSSLILFVLVTGLPGMWESVEFHVAEGDPSSIATNGMLDI